MKKTLFFLALCFVAKLGFSQAIYKSIFSEKLNEYRQLKILLPRGYSDENKDKYPLVIVLDGDYLFEPVAGDVDYMSYWEDMPKAIVVGIKHNDKRFEDCLYSEQNSLPIDQGADFFEFIGIELIPYLEDNFKTENFRVIVGHGETANFINYYLLKEIPLFQAYISISPDLAPDMTQYLTERLSNIQTKTFYYLATATNDIKHIQQGTKNLNNGLSAIDNKNFLYNFHNFEGPSHYSLPAHAIPSALESIFLVFQPISKKEYTQTILKLETSPVEYLEEKYATIKELYGIDKTILINDFKAIAAAIEKKEAYEYYEDLGKIARKEYPESLLGHYYLARFYEEMGEPKKAMKTYKEAYILEEIGGLSKDMMLDRANQIKADFGY